MKPYISILIVLLIFSNTFSQDKIENIAPVILRDQPAFNGLTMNTVSEYDYIGTINLDSFLIQRMNSQHIPGLAACIIKDTSIIWMGSYGYANITENRMVSDSTIFLLASVSKPFVAVALMQLYEDGLFDLDDSINNYLPWSVNHPSYPDSAITFKMLLTHTSAIIDNSLPLCLGDSPIPLEDYLRDYLTPSGSNYSIQNFSGDSPGSVYNYSRVGVSLCAFLVEVITGKPFNQYCEENIFKPLKMFETSWFLTGLDTSNIAMPYNNNYIPLGHIGLPDYPAGQLRSSSLQLARFLLAIKGNGKIGETRILDSTTVSLMTTVHYGPVSFGAEIDYQGLIWYKTDFGFGGRSCWGHEGLMEGVATTMFYFPDENTGAVILANTGIRQMDAMSRLFDYANLYNEIYPYDLVLSSPYMKVNQDTVAINMRFNSQGNNFSAYAIISDVENSAADSILLFDDGSHADNEANDSIWGNYILPRPDEQQFKVAISTTNLDNYRYFILDDQARFTTIGPVKYYSYRFNSDDTIFNPGDNLGINLKLKNEGATTTAKNIKCELICLDQSDEVSVSYSRNSYDDIPPGMSEESNHFYSIKISEDCSANKEFQFELKITGDDYVFWRDTFSITVQEPVLIEDRKAGAISIYPNPTTGQLFIEFERTSHKKFSSELLDMTGKVVYKEVTENKSLLHTIDLSVLPAGIYFIRINNDDISLTKKIIKAK